MLPLIFVMPFSFPSKLIRAPDCHVNQSAHKITDYLLPVWAIK